MTCVSDDRHIDAGGHGGEAIPVPIPNTEVKLSCADDSGTQSRESRWLPAFFYYFTLTLFLSCKFLSFYLLYFIVIKAESVIRF